MSPPKTPDSSALVYLISGEYGLDGELQQARQLQTQLAAQGRQMVIVGDGQHMLTEQEVHAGFSGINGPYHVMIGTHGENAQGTLRLQFVPPGITPEQSQQRMLDVLHANGVTDELLAKPNTPELNAEMKRLGPAATNVGWASAGDLFKMFPPGVQSVMTTACHGSAVRSDTRYLPDGVPVFSVAVAEIPALISNIERGTKSFLADPNNTDPMDMYLNYVVNGLDVGYAQRELTEARGGERPALGDTIPTEIAVAKGKSIQLDQPLRDHTPVAISSQTVDRMTDIIMRNEHVPTYYGITAEGGPILDAKGAIQPQSFTRENVRNNVQRLADSIGRGDYKDQPFMMFKPNETTTKIHLIMDSQVAVGLIGAEVDRVATEKHIDIGKAFAEVNSPAETTPAPKLPIGLSADKAAQALAAVCGSMRGMNDGVPRSGGVVVPSTQCQAPTQTQRAL